MGLCALPLFLAVAIKFFLPLAPVRTACSTLLDAIVAAWISINGVIINCFIPTTIRATGVDSFEDCQSSLVTSNHQCWADILIVQKMLNRCLPVLKFFIKKELIWVPVLGQCWWALGYPFMKRYSRAYLEKPVSYTHLTLPTNREV